MTSFSKNTADSDVGAALGYVPMIRALGASDAAAFSSLRRELTAHNPIPMGLTMEEELGRTLESFAEQLSYPAPPCCIRRVL